MTFPGIGVHRRPQPAHQGCGQQVVTLHVADDKGDLTIAPVHPVVEVAANLDAGRGCPVSGRDAEAWRGHRAARQHAALEFGG